ALIVTAVEPPAHASVTVWSLVPSGSCTFAVPGPTSHCGAPTPVMHAAWPERRPDTSTVAVVPAWTKPAGPATFAVVVGRSGRNFRPANACALARIHSPRVAGAMPWVRASRSDSSVQAIAPASASISDAQDDTGRN